MCILFIAIEQHPDYPVIICANRDEFHQRPTQNIHWWPGQNILAGKDLQAGGTWLGLNRQGYFSAITNFRRPAHFDSNKCSRGDLVLQALNQNATTTAQYLAQSAEQYNDFNLVFGPLNHLQAFDSVNKKFTSLTPGFHSVCNGALDDIWPKMALGLNSIEALISANSIDIQALFDVMSNQTTANTQDLPATGISPALESLLSSIFIQSADYGTRSTTLILQATCGKVEVFDRNYDVDGTIVEQRKFQLSATKPLTIQ
ncbi:Uncharacterized conserved protein, contains NRDE domain [Colwellia chukchiensis]|uniref:Uncharacterized conserved protein, contains NRDE domain n=1 Tax=Colwellia chukchiensis TaxID=641665 RepID=A0A1H7H037_9GAMM|nr:NRDE family protein [Colwellia chukchiensis]SEK42642.1 Uncharacterized conserved protein, contains NRDE domain [Colwellia chukchiensis]